MHDISGNLQSSAAFEDTSFAPDWADMTATDHFVQLYDSDTNLIDALVGYFSHGLRFSETCVLVGTPEHVEAVLARLSEKDARQIIVLDCDATLSQFMWNGHPNAERFDEVIGALVSKLCSGRKPVRIYGEMVASLVAAGNDDAAIELEHLWNDLGRKFSFRLFCGYPEASLAPGSKAAVCAAHSHLVA